MRSLSVRTLCLVALAGCTPGLAAQVPSEAPKKDKLISFSTQQVIKDLAQPGEF